MQSLESNSVLEKRKRYRQNIYENITFDSLYVNFKPTGSDPAIKETIIHDLVENCLRKSLRKTVCGSSGSGKIAIKEVIKKLTAAITAPRNFQKFIQKISKEELAAFLKILNEDYEKENRIR